MSHPQRFREIGETIVTGDICRTIEGHPVPAVHSVGRTVRQENFGYVLTTQPHKESLDAQETRLRNNRHTEAYEVHA